MIRGRLFSLIPLLLLSSIMVFGLTRLIPGDPAVAIAGEQATPENLERIREELGLNEPVVTQYLSWARDAIRGDLGTSIFTAEPVGEAIAQRLPVTLYLVGVATLLAVVVGVSAGVVAAAREDRAADRLIVGVANVLVASPSFVVGLMLVLAFAVRLGWFPATGFMLPSEGLPASLRYVFLPALAVSCSGIGELIHQVRSGMAATLKSEYALALRSRGISTRRLLYVHGLRNASLPIVTIIALVFQRLLGASVVVEVLFAIPGLGSLGVAAVQYRDIPILQGVVLILVVVVILVNLLTDLTYRFLDPRVRV